MRAGDKTLTWGEQKTDGNATLCLSGYFEAASARAYSARIPTGAKCALAATAWQLERFIYIYVYTLLYICTTTRFW